MKVQTDPKELQGQLKTVKVAGADVGATANLYAAAQLVGKKITLTNVCEEGRGVILEAVAVQDLTKQSSVLSLVFFDADPSGTTFTDNSAFDVADADIVKIVGNVNIAAANYAALNDNSVACVGNIGLPLVPAAGRTLYCCVVSGGTPTYAANELSLALTFRVV